MLDSKPSQGLLDNCLFFTANSLARVITRLGEEEFQRTGMTSSSAFLLMHVVEEPKILQKELADRLHLAPSTVSRMVDSLVRAGLVIKEGSGRNTLISPTPAGRDRIPDIQAAWKSLYRRYCEVLGKDAADELTRLTREAMQKLEG